jgi:hypothetical protein
MAKHNIDMPPGIHIAALQQRKRAIGNLMEAGPGTPWEDRGHLGAIPAFFKTAFMSLTKPGTLLRQIRRPETVEDVRKFVIICGVFWGLSWVIHSVIDFMKDKDAEFDIQLVVLPMVLKFGAGMLGTWLLLNAISRLFFALASAGEMQAKVPPTLSFNVFGYCMGPSIFALIPFYIGPGIALAWIVGLWIYGAINRMAIKVAGAVVCTLISAAGFVGGSVGAYFLLRWVYNWLNPGGPDIPEPIKIR